MFSHISLERKCFGLEEDVEDVFMYWFCRLDSSSFAHCSYFQHLPALLPVPSAERLLLCACFFFALARLKFYASTGCVRIGFGSILSCLFVCVWCVCLCMWCVWLCLCCATTPRWILTMRFDWCCLFLGCFLPPPEAAASCTTLPRPSSSSCSSSFPSSAAYNQFKCAAVHCKKFLLLLSAKSQCEAIKSGIVGHRMRLHYVWLLMLVCYRGVEVG